MTVGWQVALIAALILVNAALAGSEMALVSLRENQLNRLARSGGAGAVVARLARDPTRFLSAVQLGITLGGFLASAVAAISLAEPLAPVFRPLGQWAEPLAVVVVTVGLTAVTIVLGELVPKRLAMQVAEPWARVAAAPLSTFALVTAPVIWILSNATDVLVRVLGGDPKKRRAAITEEDVREVISIGAASPEHRAVLFGAMKIARRPIGDVFVHRRDVVAFESETPSSEALARLVATTHTRAPVYSGDLDHILGIVHLRDMIGADGTVGDRARPALTMPRTVKVLPALLHMQREHEQIAVVVNEHDGTEGIVTMEDLLEEVVGEIHDEFDPDQQAAVRTAGGGVEVPGSMPVHDLADMGIDLPVGNYATIGGLINAQLGRLPTVGDTVAVDGWNISVLAVRDLATEKVRIEPSSARSDDSGVTARLS